MPPEGTDTAIDFPVVSDEYFIAVGKLAMQWAVLQAIMDEGIQVLAGMTPNAGLCVTAQFSTMPSKASTLLALLDMRKCPPDLYCEMSKLLSQAEPHGGVRNEAIHGALQIDDQRVVRRFIKARRKFKVTFGLLDAEPLNVSAAEISAVTSRFLRLFARIVPTLSTLT